MNFYYDDIISSHHNLSPTIKKKENKYFIMKKKNVGRGLKRIYIDYISCSKYYSSTYHRDLNENGEIDNSKRHKDLSNKKKVYEQSEKNHYLYNNEYERKNRSINNYKKNKKLNKEIKKVRSDKIFL